MIARARFRRALAISRSVGSLSRVLTAAAGRPCAALVVVAAEPIVFVAAGAVVVSFSDAVIAGRRRAAGAAASFEPASAVSSGAWSLRFDLRCRAGGVGCALFSRKRVFGLVEPAVARSATTFTVEKACVTFSSLAAAATILFCTETLIVFYDRIVDAPLVCPVLVAVGLGSSVALCPCGCV